MDGTDLTMGNGMAAGSEWLHESRAAFVRAKDELISAANHLADFYANAAKTSSIFVAAELKEHLLNVVRCWARSLRP